MALLFNKTKNHLLGYSNRALCTVLWKMNCSISARTLVSQLHCIPASVSCYPNTLSAHRKLAPNTSSVKTSLLKSYTTLGFLVLNYRQFSSESSIPVTLWKLGRLNHIAIAVPDLDKATAFYRWVLVLGSLCGSLWLYLHVKMLELLPHFYNVQA